MEDVASTKHAKPCLSNQILLWRIFVTLGSDNLGVGRALNTKESQVFCIRQTPWRAQRIFLTLKGSNLKTVLHQYPPYQANTFKSTSLIFPTLVDIRL